jgi:hypothetical protein
LCVGARALTAEHYSWARVLGARSGTGIHAKMSRHVTCKYHNSKASPVTGRASL